MLAESTKDSPWLQIALVAIPAIASTTAAYFGALQWMRKRREKSDSAEQPSEQLPTSPPPPQPQQIDPITMMLIESLQSDIRREREISAELQRGKIADSGTIARLMAELSDAEARLLECIEANRRKEMDNEELRIELRILKDRLARMSRYTPEGNH
jgi:hypothetical protein